MTSAVDYSDTAREIDKEVREIIEKQYKLVQDTIRGNRERLDRLAEALLIRETLGSEEIRAAIAGEELPARQQVEIPNASGRGKDKPQKEERPPLFGGASPKPATGEA